MSFVYVSHIKLFDVGFFLTRNFCSNFNYVLHGVELVDEFIDSRFPKIFKASRPIEKRLSTYRHIFSRISKHKKIITSEDLVRSFV